MKSRKAERRLVISFVLFLLLWAGGTKAWGELFSMDDYRSTINESIERLETWEGRLSEEEIHWLERDLGAGLIVRNSSGEEVSVDTESFHHWLSQARDSSEGREELLAHLRALSRQLPEESEGDISEGVDWEESQYLLDEVFQGRELRYLVNKKTPAWQAYLGKILKAFGRWLEKHLPSLSGASGRWIRYIIYGLILVLGAILIVWIVNYFGPVGWRWKGFGAKPAIMAGDAPERDWEEWRAEAKQKAQDGAFREAIRLLFISVLVEGHQRDWWIYESEATNREHLSRIEGQTDRREALKTLIELYEKAWYGLGQPGRKEFQHCEQLVNRMEAAV